MRRSEAADQLAMERPARPVRLLAIKCSVIRLMQSAPARWLIGAVFGSTVPFRGTRIRTRRRGSYEAPLLLAGIYERAEIDFVHRYLPSDRKVIELGASIGGNSCQIARKLDRGVAMACIEANPEIVPILRENIGRNCGDRPVEVIHAMVASHTGVGSLNIAESTLVSAAGGGSRTVEVPALTLTDIVERLGGGAYSLVSDIEGAEVSLFTDHRAALANCGTMIIECHATEWGGRHYSLEEVTQLPVAGGEWEIIDRYGAVAVYRRVK